MMISQEERHWAEIAHRFRKVFGEDLTDKPISEHNFYCLVCGMDTIPGKTRVEGVCINCTMDVFRTPEEIERREAYRLQRLADNEALIAWNAMSAK